MFWFQNVPSFFQITCSQENKETPLIDNNAPCRNQKLKSKFVFIVLIYIRQLLHQKWFWRLHLIFYLYWNIMLYLFLFKFKKHIQLIFFYCHRKYFNQFTRLIIISFTPFHLTKRQGVKKTWEFKDDI